MTTKKKTHFDIIWLAILNREELKKNKTERDGLRSLKKRSSFTFSTCEIDLHFFSAGLVFTPEVFKYVKKYEGLGVQVL